MRKMFVFNELQLSFLIFSRTARCRTVFFWFYAVFTGVFGGWKKMLKKSCTVFF